MRIRSRRRHAATHPFRPAPPRPRRSAHPPPLPMRRRHRCPCRRRRRRRQRPPRPSPRCVSSTLRTLTHSDARATLAICTGSPISSTCSPTCCTPTGCSGTRLSRARRPIQPATPLRNSTPLPASSPSTLLQRSRRRSPRKCSPSSRSRGEVSALGEATYLSASECLGLPRSASECLGVPRIASDYLGLPRIAPLIDATDAL